MHFSSGEGPILFAWESLDPFTFILHLSIWCFTDQPSDKWFTFYADDDETDFNQGIPGVLQTRSQHCPIPAHFLCVSGLPRTGNHVKVGPHLTTLIALFWPPWTDLYFVSYPSCLPNWAHTNPSINLLFSIRLIQRSSNFVSFINHHLVRSYTNPYMRVAILWWN